MNPAPPEAGGSLDQARVTATRHWPILGVHTQQPQFASSTTTRIRRFSRLFSVLYTQDSLYTLLILEEDITATTQAQLRHQQALNR